MFTSFRREKRDTLPVLSLTFPAQALVLIQPPLHLGGLGRNLAAQPFLPAQRFEPCVDGGDFRAAGCRAVQHPALCGQCLDLVLFLQPVCFQLFQCGDAVMRKKLHLRNAPVKVSDVLAHRITGAAGLSGQRPQFI